MVNGDENDQRSWRSKALVCLVSGHTKECLSKTKKFELQLMKCVEDSRYMCTRPYPCSPFGTPAHLYDACTGVPDAQKWLNATQVHLYPYPFRCQSQGMPTQPCWCTCTWVPIPTGAQNGKTCPTLVETNKNQCKKLGRIDKNIPSTYWAYLKTTTAVWKYLSSFILVLSTFGKD